MNKHVIILVVFTFLTLTSMLPLNNTVTNNNSQNASKSKEMNTSITTSPNSKLSAISSPKSSYTYSEKFNVSGVVDEIYYLVNITGVPSSDYAGYLWYVPSQSVNVYIGVNPCVSRSNGYCVAEPTPNSGYTLSNYQLNVTQGPAITGGTSNPSYPEYDATYGMWSSSSSINAQQYYNYLKYDFQVQMPSQVGLSSLGISGSSTTIYEYYPGNFTNPGWTISATNISISSDNDVHVTPSTGPHVITAHQNTTSIDFTTYSLNTSYPLYSTQINYNITYSNGTILCGTGLGNCTSGGLSVTEIGNSSYNDLTDANGRIRFNISFIALNSALEDTYNLSIYAVFVHPTAPGAIDWSNQTYFLTQNKGNSSTFTVSYQYQTPVLSKDNVPSSPTPTNMYPFTGSPTNPQIRPGNYFEGYVRSSVYSGSINVTNALLIPTLTDSNGNNYTSQLNGGFASLSYPNGNYSNSNGAILFLLNLSYAAPLKTFTLSFKGNYTGVQLQDPTYINSTTSSNFANYTFTVSNLFDDGHITYQYAVPGTQVKLTTSVTTLTVYFQATANVNPTYSAYASNYGSSISSPYNLVGLPVNATIINNNSSINGVTLSVASGFTSYNSTFYYTNATGYIAFVLSTKYPDTYNLTTFQLSLISDYAPMIASNIAQYRFTRDTGPPVTNTTTATSAPVSFNPHYTVVGIKYVSNNITLNTNSFNLRPGDGAYFVYQTYNTSNNSPIAGVQFNFSITLGATIAGVSITTNNTQYLTTNYYLSDANGYIFIFFSSTYNTTPETTAPINFKIGLYLDISLFNQTTADSNFYIGTNHATYTNYLGYENTWSFINSTTFNISADYLYAVPLFTAIPDYQILDPTTNLVRPNNETILIRIKVVYLDGSAIIPNFNFPVKLSFVTPITGVTISNVPGFSQLSTTNYYLTNSSGYIDFYLKIDYQLGYSKFDTIKLNASVDFGNDTCVSGCSTHMDRWIVGLNPVKGAMLSQWSYSNSNSSTYLTIHKAPVYDTGKVTAGTAYIKGGSPASPLNVLPNTIVYLPFTVSIVSNTNSSYDKIGGAYLQGIKVYLNETQINGYGMTLLNSSLTTDVNGLVTFQVNVSTVNDGNYPFSAFADFENDQGASASKANLTGTFNYFWLNGSISAKGIVNTIGFTIQNYSNTSLTTVWVKRAHLLTITITNVYDKNNNPVTINSAYVQILRGYRIQLSISYTDQFGVGLSNTLNLAVQVINPVTNQIQNINPFSVTTVSGLATASITTNANFYVGKAGIIGSDPNIGANPFVLNPANFTIMSELSFVSTPTLILPHNSNEVFSGEQVTITGSLRDELGLINSSSYSSTVKNQIINSIQLAGFNNSYPLTSIGTNTTGVITFTSSSASFSFNWTLPLNYNLQSFNLRVSIPDSTNTIYFVKSNSTLYTGSNGLPVYQITPFSYQNVNLKFSLSNSNATNVITNGSSFLITQDYTGSVSVSGVLTDNYGRVLSNRLVQLSNGAITYNILTDSSGSFGYLNFISQSNVNGTYTINLRYLSPYNGLNINNLTATLSRLVFDTYAPVLTINPGLNNTYVYQDTLLNLSVIDPTYVNGQLVASTGVNNATGELYANGKPIWTYNVTNPYYQYIASNYRNVSSVYFEFTILDNSNNNLTAHFTFLIDLTSPTISTVNPTSTNEYAYLSNYTFQFSANDSQSGIDNTTAFVRFESNFGSIASGTEYNMTFDPNTNTFVSTSFDFYKLTQNVDVQFFIKDKAGNEGNSSVLVLLPDLVKPTITLDTPTNNSNVMSPIVNFSYTVSDAQSGINESTISLFVFGNLTADNNSLTITNHGSYYTVSGQLTRNQFNLQYSTQDVTLTVLDNNGNENSLTTQLHIDNIGPQITANTVYQPANISINTATTNLTTAMQYVNFQFSDSGTPTTGVNPSYIQIRLTINKTFSVVITISNNQLTVSNSSFTNDFSFDVTNSEITLGWNATNLANYGFSKTHKVQNIPIEWSVVSLNDNFGNPLRTSKYSTVSYTIDVEALPPPPNVLVELASLAFTFLIFIVIGIGAAFIFEKIRYVG